MFNRHLPDPIYEHLPWIYAAVAVLVAFVFTSGWRWIPVAALVAACLLTAWQRHRYRSGRPAEPARRRGREQRVYVPEVRPDGADRPLMRSTARGEPGQRSQRN